MTNSEIPLKRKGKRMATSDALCDVCKAHLSSGQGALCNTPQVVETPAYWIVAFSGPLASFHEDCAHEGIEIIQGIGNAATHYAANTTAWLLCDRCLSALAVDDSTAKEHARLFWQSDKTYNRPDAKPAVPQIAIAAAYDGFSRVFGPLNSDSTNPTVVYAYGNGFQPTFDQVVAVAELIRAWFSGRPRCYHVGEGCPIVAISRGAQKPFSEWIAEYETIAREIDRRHQRAVIESFTVANLGNEVLFVDRSGRVTRRDDAADLGDAVVFVDRAAPLPDILDDIGQLRAGTAVFFVSSSEDRPVEQALPAAAASPRR